MASDYLVQIVHRETGKVAEWAPGLRVETEFVENVCERVRQKGVGFVRTEAHVIADVRQAIRELLHDLKAQV